MFKSILAIAMAVISFSSVSYAGSANASLECVSDSGKTKLIADIPGDYSSAAVSVIVEGKELHRINEAREGEITYSKPQEQYPGYEVAIISSVASISQKVLTIQVLDKKYESTQLLLIAQPETVRGNNANATFRATLTTKDPRDGNKYIRYISVSCKYGYSI
ncbi:hypothetical protein ACLVWU_09365 [Bdellovibrio sp. HCB290]|uniref:hypothetical protein n=1 Tax=Bdellovibrio sp. HCB290 TaxID=3394356 RepID=UPI0039B50B90